jgi:hypothetical protein
VKDCKVRMDITVLFGTVDLTIMRPWWNVFHQSSLCFTTVTTVPVLRKAQQEQYFTRLFSSSCRGRRRTRIHGCLNGGCEVYGEIRNGNSARVNQSIHPAAALRGSRMYMPSFRQIGQSILFAVVQCESSQHLNNVEQATEEIPLLV